jgi:AAA family ATP:ADP antiporter
MPRLFDVREGEGRVALFGFAALLLLIITGHTVLEAARDALLLGGPGPRALGVVYMAIAIAAWPAAGMASRAAERYGARRSLAGLLVGAAALPVAFFAFPRSTATSMAVYVVSGLIGSILVPQFWTVVGKVLTMAQGRRLFGLIAAAGVLGGVLGSGTAAAMLVFLPVRGLLILSAAFFVAAGVALLRLRGDERAAPPALERSTPMAGSLRSVADQPLVRRIALAVVVSTATLLVVDYYFKSTIARALPPERIGPFVARYYLALNGLSLAVQLLLSGAVVRRMGVTAAVVLTPLLLLVGAAGALVAGGAMGAVLVMKGIDGSLRFSIHRITGELVYLPVPPAIRQRVKPLIDGALARASQTVTGAALLAVGGTWVLAPRPLAVVVTLLSAAWLGVALGLRRPYLGLLRRAITSGALHAHDSPVPLDLESAKLLVQRLASQDPFEVIGAMNMLSRRGHEGFVPALVLLHSDEAVLTQALEHFAASSRTDWIPQARRLLDDPREPVRMAAARALAMHGQLDLELLAKDVGWRVRGYAAVDLALRDGSEDVLEHDRVASLLREAGTARDAASLGMLAAITDASPTASLSRLLVTLSHRPVDSLEWTELLARAAAQQGDARLVPALVGLLGASEGRESIRSTLVTFGDPAMEAAWWALRDPQRPRRLRIHLPKTIGRFGSREAAEHLLESIETEEDGLVRYKSIRALELLVAQRRVQVDRGRAERLALADLVKHVRLFAQRAALGAPRGTCVAEPLLDGLLEDKIRQSLERVFRLLAIAHPREDYRRVRLACLSEDVYLRANARELLDALLRRRDQQALRVLLRLVTDDLPAAERIERAAPLVPRGLPRTREEALRSLMVHRDPTLSALATLCAQQAAGSSAVHVAPSPEATHA